MSDAARSALGLLGLGLRAGRVSVGVDAAHAALQRGRAEAVVLPSDAGARARDKLVPLARHRRVPVLIAPDAARLGQALGRPPVHGVAVLDRQLARGLTRHLATERETGEG